MISLNNLFINIDRAIKLKEQGYDQAPQLGDIYYDESAYRKDATVRMLSYCGALSEETYLFKEVEIENNRFLLGRNGGFSTEGIQQHLVKAIRKNDLLNDIVKARVATLDALELETSNIYPVGEGLAKIGAITARTFQLNKFIKTEQ